MPPFRLWDGLLRFGGNVLPRIQELNVFNYRIEVEVRNWLTDVSQFRVTQLPIQLSIQLYAHHASGGS